MFFKKLFKNKKEYNNQLPQAPRKIPMPKVNPIKKDIVTKKMLKDYDHIEDLLEENSNQIKTYTIYEVMETENVEFVTGAICIVKNEYGCLRLQSCDGKTWSDVHMSKSYLNAKYIKLLNDDNESEE